MKNTIVVMFLICSFFYGHTQSGKVGSLSYNFNGETLTISGKGAMPDYNESDFRLISDEKELAVELAYANPDYEIFLWNKGRDVIKNIVIEEGVTHVGNWAFAFCRNLTTISLSGSITSLGHHAFYGCENLIIADIPEKVSQIGEAVFGGNSTSLQAINVSDKNLHYISIDGVLFNSDMTVLLQYPCAKPEALYSIPEDVAAIGDYAFSYSRFLTTVIVPQTLTTIGQNAFSNSKSLYQMAASEKLLKDNTFYIPSTVTEIGAWAFCACKNMKNVYLLCPVTNLLPYTFYECKNLTSIAFFASIDTIGERAFARCGLTSVYFIGDKPPVCEKGVFAEMNQADCKLFVMNKKSIKAFRKANGWKSFGWIGIPQE